MFKPVSQTLNVTLVEEEVLRFWRSHRISEMASAQHSATPVLLFNDGSFPVNRKPALVDFLTWTARDILPRYKAMCGFQVVRRGAWQAHGLPVEMEGERRLGLIRKNQIESAGVAAFNQTCRQAVLENVEAWTQLAERGAVLGDARENALTSENDHITRVWDMVKGLWDQGLIYEDFRVVPYCPRCATVISQREANLGQVMLPGLAVYLRFPLVEDPGTSLLVFTDKPWMLPANAAVAVNPAADYVIVEHDLAEGGVEKLILAQNMVEEVFDEKRQNAEHSVRVFESFKGEKLRGLRYHPLFTFISVDKPAYFVIVDDFVNAEEGTGLVALAPAYESQHLAAAVENDLPILLATADDGMFLAEIRPWRGKFFFDSSPLIVDELQRRGLVFSLETRSQSAPHCIYCHSPLLFTVHNAWNLRSAQVNEHLLAPGQAASWYEKNLREALSRAALDEGGDWVLGRERFWGAPLPIWECAGCHLQICVGSPAELSHLAGRNLEGLDLHRQVVDGVRFSCTRCGDIMQRVIEVVDHRLETTTGIYLQDASSFDIQEIIGQSSAINEDTIYPERDLHSADLNELITEFGVDALRWCGQSGQGFSAQHVAEVFQAFISPLWDTYAFFVLTANAKGWTPGAVDFSRVGHKFDQLLLSEFQAIVQEVTRAYDQLDLPRVTSVIEEFISGVLLQRFLPHLRDSLANNQNELDQSTALSALYQVLVGLSRIIAPVMPFLAEEIYQNLVVFAYDQTSTHASVQHAGWLSPDPRWVGVGSFTDTTPDSAEQPPQSKGRGVRKQGRVAKTGT